MSKKKMEPINDFIVYDRFIYEGLRSMGWSTESSIFELMRLFWDWKSIYSIGLQTMFISVLLTKNPCLFRFSLKSEYFILIATSFGLL